MNNLVLYILKPRDILTGSSKVLVEKCTPQQARVEIKTQLKPANKPKVKVNKVTIPSDTENTNNIVLFLARYF
jgi:hypothetical protein